jgi:hypothetical protein
MSMRALATALYRRKVPFVERLNRNVDFESTVPAAFATARHFVDPDRGKRMQHTNIKIPLYQYVNEVLGNVPIVYLEFGVFRGWSIKQWLNINTHPESRFVGFDTFTGLPEDWMEGRKAGHFNVEGKPPQIDDPRVRFVPGLFQHTLPGFLESFRIEHPLVVHIDCDLYSGTLYCLATLDRVMPAGTIVMFDEFYDLLHEYAGFRDYCTAFMREWRAVAYRDSYVQAAVQLL